MHTIYDLVTLDAQNEHDLEHTLEHKKQFPTPKIFDANGDLSKRWYIYFSYRYPETDKLQRMKNIYGKSNRFKTKSERYSVLNLYKKRLHKFLKDGYNPFEDNTELHLKSLNQNKASKSNIEEQQKPLKLAANIQQQQQENATTIKEAFNKAILLKTKWLVQKP